MAANKLREFFREKKTKAGPGKINWQARKDAWIAAVQELYGTIQHYLKAAAKDRTVEFSFQNKEIAEDYIGQYTVQELVLRVGDEKVIFSPKGTNVVGAAGRVDLLGDMGEVTIVRQEGDRWGVVASRTPTLKVIELNEESLLTALESVMRR